MKTRATTAIAVAAAAAVILSGCSFVSPQRTETRYTATDGISVNLGQVRARNVLLMTNDEGTQANLVYAGVNDTNQSAQLTAKVGDQTVTVQLGFGQDAVTPVGFDGPQEIVTGSFESGATMPVEFTATYVGPDGQTQTQTLTQFVPILGDDDPNSVLLEYSTLMPTTGTSATIGAQ